MKSKTPLYIALLFSAVIGFSSCSNKDKIYEKPVTIEVKDSQLGTLKKTFSPQVANSLEKQNIPLEKAIYYNEHFTNKNPDFVESYFYQIYHSVSPSEANKFNYPRFELSEIYTLVKRSVPADSANKFNNYFSAEAIANVMASGIPIDSANAYDKRFSPLTWFQGNVDLIKFYEEKFYPFRVNSFSENFDNNAIYNMLLYNIDSKKANSYVGFSGKDVFDLCQNDIGPEVANKYGKLNVVYGSNLSCSDIIKIRENKIPFETVKTQAQKNYVNDVLD